MEISDIKLRNPVNQSLDSHREKQGKSLLDSTDSPLQKRIPKNCRVGSNENNLKLMTCKFIIIF